MASENNRPYLALGLRMAAHRKRVDMSQTQYAAWLGTSQGRVSRIETGHERPTKGQALQLSEHAGIAAHHWDKVELANSK